MFEIVLVFLNRVGKERDEDWYSVVEFLVDELKKVGLVVERVFGFNNEFVKVIFVFFLVFFWFLVCMDFCFCFWVFNLSF